MIRRRRFLKITLLISLFFFITVWFVSNVSKSEKLPQISNTQEYEDEIYRELALLSAEYKTKSKIVSNFTKYFLNNMKSSADLANLNYNNVWKNAKSWVSKMQLYEARNSDIREVCEAMKVGKIIKADLDSRGTQLKFLFTLEVSDFFLKKLRVYLYYCCVDNQIVKLTFYPLSLNLHTIYSYVSLMHSFTYVHSQLLYFLQ